MILQPVLIRIPYWPDLSGPKRVERQRTFARIALAHCARLCGAPAGVWPQTPERVPIPRDGFHWSIAHKPRFAAAVIASVPVGIDVESITPRARDLSTAIASPEEWALLTQSRDRKVWDPPWRGADVKNGSVAWRTFFEMWTAKEATLKANSKGIGGLNACRFARVGQKGRFVLSYEGREFSVEHFAYADHIAACTCDDARLNWHVIEGPIGT